MAGHVFISHGSDNRDEASALAAFLEAGGVTVWIAPRDVRPGMDYSEQLQEAIEGCVAFVVLVTAMANKSPYVRAETEMAFSGGKPIFPVRLSDIKPASGLAFFLKIRHWTDAYGPGRDASLDRLARELQNLCGVAPAAPSPPAAAPAPSTSAPASPRSADDELRAAAIGPNADYFLKHWARMDATGKSYDWNWAACILNFCWFAFRKMWLPAVGIGLVYVVTTPLLDPGNKMLFRVTALFVVGLSFVTGGWGNKLYRNQIDRLVAGTAGMSREDAIDHVRRRGGTSVPALVASILAILALGMLVALALAMQKAAANPALTAAAAPAAGNALPPPQPGNDATGAPVLDQNFLIGRWTDDGDCSRAYEFTADGRFIAADGGIGGWSLDGDRLTASGPGGSATLRVAPIDRNTMSATSPDGGSGTSTRC
jgi:hypothetical protein